jgi:DNA processing protein
LASKGVVIISGLALGADSVAHQACMRAGGQTIAVLPSGPKRIYPSTHRNLAIQIIKTGGAILTEYDDDYMPHKYDFLRRNRLVAAISDGILVTEAAARSGTLNTANHALELGIPVFAIPGNITNPLSAGCNNLIKAGAIPVTCVEDIFNALKWKDTSAAPKNIKGSTEEEQIIIDLLTEGISDGAELLVKSELEASKFNQALTMLEITGSIHPTGANHWML